MLLQDTGISSKAMSIMNSFINDIFEKIGAETAALARYVPHLHNVVVSRLARHRTPLCWAKQCRPHGRQMQHVSVLTGCLIVNCFDPVQTHAQVQQEANGDEP